MKNKIIAFSLSVVLMASALDSCKNLADTTNATSPQLTLYKIGNSDTISTANPMIHWATDVDVTNFGYSVLSIGPIKNGLTTEQALDSATKIKVTNNTTWQYLAKPVLLDKTHYATRVSMFDRSGGLVATSNALSWYASGLSTQLRTIDFNQEQFSTITLTETTDPNTNKLTGLNIDYTTFNPDPTLNVAATLIQVPCCYWYPDSPLGTCEWDEASTRRDAFTETDENNLPLYTVVGVTPVPEPFVNNTITMLLPSPLDPDNCYLLELNVINPATATTVWSSTYYYGQFSHL